MQFSILSAHVHCYVFGIAIHYSVLIDVSKTLLFLLFGILHVQFDSSHSSLSWGNLVAVPPTRNISLLFLYIFSLFPSEPLPVILCLTLQLRVTSSSLNAIFS